MSLEILSNTPSVSNGSTIVFCHGAWHDARCWQPTMMPYFADKGFQCIAPSYRNHGQSTSKGSLKFRRISEYVEDVASVVDALAKEQKVYLIGHSMGGLVVQKFLENYPNRIEKAALIASVPPQGVWRVTLKSLFQHPLTFLKVNLIWSLAPLISTSTLVKELFYSEKFTDSDVLIAMEKLQDESYLAYLDMLIFNLPNPKKIKTPIHVIGGEKDYIFSKHEVEQTAQAYNTTALILRGEAHNLFLESQWEVAAESILHFFNKI